MKIKVADILNRPHFENAEVIAGKNGLQRPIHWVHVVELETFGHLLNGQEMVLTTGIAWMNNPTKAIAYLQQLINNQASVLCIELDEKKNHVPKEMIALANAHDFPIILFHKEVRFIDITRDIHTLLLQYEQNIWLDLEALYKEMHQHLIADGSMEPFLQILHKRTKKQIALIQHEEQTWFFPKANQVNEEKWLKNIEIHQYFSIPIYFLNDIIATLYIIDEVDAVSLFDQFAANRCSEFLTQYFWKYYQEHEVKQVKKNEWILAAVTGVLDEAGIFRKINQSLTDWRQHASIIGVVPEMDKHLQQKKNKHFYTNIFMNLRAIFEAKGFHLLASIDKENQQLILLLINQLDEATIYNRLQAAKEDITLDKKLEMAYLSFGKVIKSFKDIPSAYETACITLDYQEKVKVLAKPFYRELASYRIINQFKNQDELPAIVTDYLGPLMAYDLEKNADLLQTLEVFLANFGAKKETAEQLFIVRQTLYHRLEKIAEILGADYLQQEKRMMLEFALATLKYLKQKDEWDT